MLLWWFVAVNNLRGNPLFFIVNNLHNRASNLAVLTTRAEVGYAFIQ